MFRRTFILRWGGRGARFVKTLVLLGSVFVLSLKYAFSFLFFGLFHIFLQGN